MATMRGYSYVNYSSSSLVGSI